jgi:hypothetical protein
MFQGSRLIISQKRARGLRAYAQKFASGAGLLLLAGCAGAVVRQDGANFDTRLNQGDYKGAAEVALASGKINPDGSSSNLAWSLNAGAALTYAGDAPRAVAVLDGAEKLMKNRDLDGLGNMGQYHYATYDGVMANTYKALNFLAEKDVNNARTEFIRLDDRQRRAKDDFEKEKTRLDAKAARSGIDIAAMMKGVQKSSEYEAAERDIQNFASYQPFINPLSTYLYDFHDCQRGNPV